MLGAIIGDIVGSRFEFDWNNYKAKDFELFDKECRYTDETILTAAVEMALVRSKGDWTILSSNTVKLLKAMVRKYPAAQYGTRFFSWATSDNTKPYNSFGNGAAMRVSAVPYFAKTLQETKLLSELVTEVTHNHPEGLKGAEATSCAIYLALHGRTKEQIRELICRDYYNIDFTLDQIRTDYCHDESCRNSVPQALEAFFESRSFEDAIRNAVSIGGDSDTIAAITGSVAEAYYGIPEEIKEKAYTYLDTTLMETVRDFKEKHCRQ